MQFYELIVIERGSGRILMRLPPAEQSWGTFSRGELIRLDGGCFPIDQVVNTFTSRDASTVCTTVLLLGPILPESALGVAIPEAAALPEPPPPERTPSPSDSGGRRWWRR